MIIWYFVMFGTHIICKVQDKKQAENIANAYGGHVEVIVSNR